MSWLVADGSALATRLRRAKCVASRLLGFLKFRVSARMLVCEILHGGCSEHAQSISYGRVVGPAWFDTAGFSLLPCDMAHRKCEIVLVVCATRMV